MPKPRKRSALKQVAALAWRRETDGSLRILLVTSRERRRWILPKGWPMKGRRNDEAAAIEAMEEAGVVGLTSRKSIGDFEYIKVGAKRAQTVRVNVYALAAEQQLDDWPEKGEREVQWFAPEDALASVDDGGARVLIQAFIRSLEADTSLFLG